MNWGTKVPPFLKQENQRTLLFLTLVPNAKENKIYGVFNDRLKVYIAAPAVDGKANKALLKYLANVFHLKQRQILLQHGEKSHQKTISLEASLSDISALLASLI